MVLSWLCTCRNQAEVIALHDCDILTYNKNLLARLVYPIANPLFNFEFCKGYYPRVTESKINGRVTRLLINPFYLPLNQQLVKEYIDYMKSFRYPLSGEFSFRKNLLTDIRIPSDWGIEIGVLSEVYRSNNLARICQVDIADNMIINIKIYLPMTRIKDFLKWQLILLKHLFVNLQ